MKDARLKDFISIEKSKSKKECITIKEYYLERLQITSKILIFKK